MPGARRDRSERAVRCGHLPRRDREPRDEADAVLGAVVEQRLALPVGHVVEVLHGGDRHDLLRRSQLVDAHLGEAHVPHLALGAQVGEDAELVLQREVRVDAVQLVEVDRLDAEAAQRHLSTLAQVGGVPAHGPLVRPLTGESGLGRDAHSAVGVQRLADQVLGDERTVRSRRCR